MQPQNHFQFATTLFYENKYEQALQSINAYIKLKPNSSMAYNNRGLIYYKLNQMDHSQQDMLQCLQISPNNYICYFNLFSIQNMQGNSILSLKNLECSLSSLNIICGKIKKDKEMIHRSLQLCHNNIEALILLILMQINQGNYTNAFDLIVKYRIDTTNPKIIKLYDNLEKMKQRYSFELQQQFYEILQQIDFQKERLRSANSFQSVLQEQYSQIVQAKLKQFNNLYKLVNKLLNKKTQFIPISNLKNQKDQPQNHKVEQKNNFKLPNHFPLIATH